jgi:NADH-quinone oxidoreductase subunit G
VSPGTAVLATWHQLLDTGRLQSGEPFLAGTAKRAVARISLATAQSVGVADGDPIAVGTDAGTITLPVVVTDMLDHVVWVPTNSLGSSVRDALHADAGDLVRLAPGARQNEEASA